MTERDPERTKEKVIDLRSAPGAVYLNPMEGELKGKSGLPLQPTLVTVVVLLIVAGAGGVGLLAYQSSRVVVDDLWQRLSGELASRTTQRTLRYLEPAVPAIHATQELAKQGRIDMSDEMSVLRHLRAMLIANPQFTWMSHASEDGTYLAVHRTPEGPLKATVRTQLPEAERGDAPTILRSFAVSDSGEIRQVDQKRGDYDPRRREWYGPGRASEGGRWVEPFIFVTVGAPGFMYVARDYREGTIRGVWAVEYEVSTLSDFLETLHIGEHGRAYVVSNDGLVVGHPGGVTTSRDGDELEIIRAERHPDSMLRDAWIELQRLGGGARSFEIGENLVMAEPFPQDTGIDWLVLVVVPASDFFGPIERQAWHNGLIAAVAALAAILLGVFFTNRVSRDLLAIAKEMGRVGRFELAEGSLDEMRSSVREINAMCEATMSMKNSLRSFGKYVPKELVSDLIRSGQEAALGGRKTQITTLFADVAGFTSTAEEMDPDDLVPLLGDFMESMSEAVREHGGTVDKYIGDAIMAFWGAPRPDAKHALNACRCAVEMQRRLVTLQARWEEQGLPQFSARIGINSGPTVVGNFGSPARMNYTVISDAVNLASRLESLNKVYGTMILVGEDTARDLDDSLLIRPLDWVTVKGKQQAILIHHLIDDAEHAGEQLRAAVELYREALELYRDRRFEEAAAKFDEANEEFGGQDQPSRVLAARARDFVENPPPDDWTGNYVAPEK